MRLRKTINRFNLFSNLLVVVHLFKLPVVSVDEVVDDGLGVAYLSNYFVIVDRHNLAPHIFIIIL